MVAFRLICDLLHCHVSDAKSPLAAISFRAAKLGCSRSGMASSLMVRRKPCMGSRVLGDPAADARATVPNNGTSMVAFRLFFFCPSPLPFGGSTVLSLTRGPAGNRTTTGSLSATQECRDTNCTTRTTNGGLQADMWSVALPCFGC